MAQKVSEAPADDLVTLDIHVPLHFDESVIEEGSVSNCVVEKVRMFNSELRERCTSEKIDFDNLHIPHVTLYQTQFYANQMDHIIDALDEVVNSTPFSSCEISLGSKVVSGDYSMLSIKRQDKENDCLQSLSDLVLNKFLPFVKFPAEIPAWVLNIQDEKIRERKIKLVELYGSPNVLDGFDPHVTVGFDDINPNLQREIMNDIDSGLGSCNESFGTLAIGHVGIGGSVLKEEIYETAMGYNLSSNTNLE